MQASTEDGPALDQRLLVINAHQILLHSAAMVEHNESPHVSEVDEHDLLGWQFDEETGEGYWCSSRHGAVGHVVTTADRDRAGSIPTETFELSLARLDDVVEADRHGDFAWLGKVRAALARRDHGQAVIEGFGICKIRCVQKHPRPRERMVALLVTTQKVCGHREGRLRSMDSDAAARVLNGSQSQPSGGFDSIVRPNILRSLAEPAKESDDRAQPGSRADHARSGTRR